jgi:protein involved in polysaccharide export with SLBB domain
MKRILPHLLTTLLVLGCGSERGSRTATPSQQGEPPPYVWVDGEFKQPGRYAWTNGMRLKDTFAVAGGFTEFAEPEIRLTHWDGSHQSFRWSASRPLEDNPPVKPGDIVYNVRH